MSFKVGDKEFSDKEVVSAYNQCVANRHQWCIDEARKYFTTKNTTKRYKMDIFYPEIDDTIYKILDDAELKKYQDFVAKTRKDFLDDYPEKADDKDYWEEWLYDTFSDAGFTTDYYPSGYYTEAKVRCVYLDDTMNTYRFDVCVFEDNNIDNPQKKYAYIDLTDEEYILLVAECLENNDMTTGGIYYRHPEIYKKIADACFKRGKESAVFLTEARQDAENILKAVGDQMPKLPQGPFADIAAILARKEELKQEQSK